MNTLISGTSSGLGRWLKEELCRHNPFGLNKVESFNRKKPTDNQFYSIIHCAWDTELNDEIENYVTNAVKLVKQLIELPHKQFVFLSSVDVYPKTKSALSWIENDYLDVRDITGLYGITKRIVEEIVIKEATNPLIIRPSILLGPHTRGNIVKLAKKEDVSVSLKSAYNFTLYSDILKVIQSDLTGIYNVVGNNTVPLSELTDFPVKDGAFIYDAGYISNEKICKVLPELNQTSKEKYETWKKEFLS